jgi:hypothetical protein
MMRPALKATPLSRLTALTGSSRRTLIDYRRGMEQATIPKATVGLTKIELEKQS